jgi:hypothetical protein
MGILIILLHYLYHRLAITFAMASKWLGAVWLQANKQTNLTIPGIRPSIDSSMLRITKYLDDQSGMSQRIWYGN